MTARSRFKPLLGVVALCAVLGVVVGVVWFLVAPRPEFVVRAEGLDYVKDLPGEYVAMDGWFAVLGLVAGLVVAVVVLLRVRLDPWSLLVVSLAGLLGSALAWGVGRLLGRDEVSGASGRAVGDLVSGPLTLHAKGVLLVWPVVTLAVLTFALAWSSRDDRPAAPPAPSSVGGDGDLGGLDRG